MKIQWIFFDMGYTLVDETAVWLRRCREQADTPEGRALGLTAETIYRDIEQASRDYLPPYRTVAEKYHFTQIAPYRSEAETLYPEAVPVLQKLAPAFRLGVIANQAAGLEERLHAFGIRQSFSVIASSWDVGALKPDPALFLYALNQAHCFPEEAVMIGDRLDNDIVPAKALGMKTVWIRQGFGGLQTPRDPESTPDFIVDSLSELPNLFSL